MDARTQLEACEWDNVWICNPGGEREMPHLVHVGDSISCQVRTTLEVEINDYMRLDNFATSKAIDNEYFLQYFDLYIRQVQDIHPVNAILFNSGLHGWHLDDGAEYGSHYAHTIDHIRDKYKVPMILLLTTPVGDNRNGRISKRNAEVIKIAHDRNLPVIDLFSLLIDRLDLLCPDLVHFSKDGYKVIAEYISEELRKILG